jgi:hypothetical protein
MTVTHDFSPNSPFYWMIGTYLQQMAAIPILFQEGNCAAFQPGDTIRFGDSDEGKYFHPFEIYQAGLVTLPHSQHMFIGYSTMMLAALAYETVKSMNDHSPEFELFRHLRNAAAHQNKFNFTNQEPRRPAAWLKQSIDHTVKGEGNLLHGHVCFGSFISPSELIDLIAHIEKRLAT